MSAHEIVIRLGRPFDIHVGGRFIEHVSEITIPFGDGQSAESARQEVGIVLRPVRDAGGEDYQPVVPGEVVRAARAIEESSAVLGHRVRTLANPYGFTEVETRAVAAGTLQVTTEYQTIRGDDGQVIGWHCTRREALLNGELVTDPARAQALADEAGIAVPPPVRWDTNAA